MNKPLNIIVAGAKGRMGQALVSLINESEELNLLGGLEFDGHPDLGKPICLSEGPKLVDRLEKILKEPSPRTVFIDFTTPHATLNHVDQCLKLSIPMVIGTTGIDESGMNKIEGASKKIPIVMAANFSIGINLITKVVEKLAKSLPQDYDLEVVETHHRMKKDAPSGTALRLARALAEGRNVYLNKVICMHREGETGKRPKDQIGVQTLRGGDIVGDHTVLFAGPGERIEITHRAHSRNNFASGALKAALWLCQDEERKSPLLYDMFDVLNMKEF